MLLSMTGYGESRHVDEFLSATVDVRAVNNRYLKVVGKYPEWMASVESEVERRVRQRVSRGTVTVSIRVRRLPRPEDFQINQVALTSYLEQLNAVSRQLQIEGPRDLAHLLALPGVVVEQTEAALPEDSVYSLIFRLLESALDSFQEFRVAEGRAMGAELDRNNGQIARQLGEIELLAPQSVVEYRQKLLERVRQSLQSAGGLVNDADLIREVAIYADRGDINEEIARLHSHLGQFSVFVSERESSGRKLDFLCQEMFRETNTMGSKSNHAGLARAVVEIKAAIERNREILQNVE
ncbi:MAG: YicC/YloC family endoribonuclease [Planctomycetaceae bacterium]